MERSSAAIERYAMSRVHLYIVAVEVAYGVSIKPWITLGSDPGTGPFVSIAAWGSGSAFDLIPEGVQPHPVRIYEAEANALGEALYWAVVHVERLLAKVKEPIGPRPSL